MSHGQGNYCDSMDKNSEDYTTSPDWFGPGWYRFQLPAGIIQLVQTGLVLAGTGSSFL